MVEKILGIDTGTNSIGWAIVEHDDAKVENSYTLIDKGVNIFQEGVKIEKGIESSRAADRTAHRRLRIGYWRRKIRKIALLKILIENNLSPRLSEEELKAWRSKKAYPLNEEFMKWQRTDDNENKNPYYYRNLCLTEKLDMSRLENRYIVGRAIYHLNQRRGFLSNRKENTKESNGDVKKGIDSLTESMHESGFNYLGQYFYDRYKKGEKIRNEYTSRIEHYEKELLKICEMQGLEQELTDKLRRTIITQRPLKSQKNSVGKCVFEPTKSRCPISHPLYEQYRMYQFINNIKIQTPFDAELRPLEADEVSSIMPLFLRKSKKDFKFEEIAKKLSGNGKSYGYYKDKEYHQYRFNYYMDTSVSGCPVIAQLSEVYGTKDVDGWLDLACETYMASIKKSGEVKNRYEIMNDIWHALFFFDDEDKLKAFAKNKLQLDDEKAEMFSKIRVPNDYASLSLKAIRKILPYMKNYGIIYSHAVFMANLYSILYPNQRKDELLPLLPQDVIEDIEYGFASYKKMEENETQGVHTKEEYVKRYIINSYDLGENGEEKLKELYHPSMIETFPQVLERTKEGYFQLGSPRTNSLRNPMAMRALFRLRHVINTLLKEGKIDEDTIIHIEFARELNDSNKRSALRRWQNDREKKNKEYADAIKKSTNIEEPTPTDILKYRLWEEQNHLCLYTGKTINITELFDSNKFDIEHTIPRSVGGDSTEMNLTICNSAYNRDIKKTMLPSEMEKEKYEEILERIDHWKKKAEDFAQQISKINTRGVSDKDLKDRLIQKRHMLILERDYWKGKYDRFVMTKVPEGFSRRQGVDISIISKYSRLYLKSLFHNISVVKGIATSDFRKIWGIQDEYEKKERNNHCHHAIDAITVACIGRAEYDKLAQYYHDEERHKWGLESKRVAFPKPWDTFTEDIKQIEKTLLVSHYTADNMGKPTRKKERKNGKLTGKYIQGDTARISLHQDTYYGAIERDGEIYYVVRKSLDSFDKKAPEKEVDNIVDDVVKQKVQEAIKMYGSLDAALAAGIWMNKEKGVKIKKVRVYTRYKNTLDIRQHRDVSRKEYKRTFHVLNDLNYMMGIYVGENKKGQEKRSYELINTLDASNYLKSNNDIDGLLPLEKNGLKLKWRLKKGTMVLLYDKSPDEICKIDKNDLSKRLYKVFALEMDGRIRLIHHQCAESSKEEDENSKKRVKCSKLNALVEGYDFEMNDIGEITFLHND